MINFRADPFDWGKKPGTPAYSPQSKRIQKAFLSSIKSPQLVAPLPLLPHL